jgi:hypothetical protein
MISIESCLGECLGGFWGVVPEKWDSGLLHCGVLGLAGFVLINLGSRILVGVFAALDTSPNDVKINFRP